MGELRDGRETQHPRDALDRMGGTEDLVEQIEIGRPLFKFKQAGFHHRDVLGGFFKKCGVELGKIVAHS